METIERAFRQCRGEAPVEIYRESSNTSGDGEMMPEQPSGLMGGLGGLGGLGGAMAGDGRVGPGHGPGVMIDDLFRGFFGVDPHGLRRQRPPPHHAHPAYEGEGSGSDQEDQERRKRQRYRRYDRRAEEV